MIDILSIAIAALTILFTIAGFIIQKIDKSIAKAHERIDSMNDVVVTNVVFDRLREDIKDMKDDIIGRIDSINSKKK